MKYKEQRIEMAYEIYLIRGVEGEERSEFRSRVLDDTCSRCAAEGPEELKVALTVAPPPRFAVIPFKNDLIATVSVSGREDENEAGIWREILAGVEGFAGGYRVEHALPASYSREWPLEEQTPSPGLLTLFRKKQTLSDDEFVHRWYHGHTPLSFRIHPLWHYDRNRVTQPVVDPSEPFDGIVLEMARTAEDLIKPWRFFGGPLRMPINMLRVFVDINRFIDYGSIETYYTTEYILVE